MMNNGSNWVTGIDFDKLIRRQESRMRIVHKEDQPTVQLIEPDIKTGPWIAGGAVLNWYNNEPVGSSDYDVFFATQRQFDETFGRLMRNNANMVYNSENAITLQITIDSMQRTIQLIRKKWFESASAVIENFDFTICQLATDGSELVLGATTAQDINDKRIALCKVIQPDIVKRIVKYVTYGYEPSPALMQEILDREDDFTWKFNSVEDGYENAL